MLSLIFSSVKKVVGFAFDISFPKNTVFLPNLIFPVGNLTPLIPDLPITVEIEFFLLFL